MNSKRAQAQLAKLLPKDHPALKSIGVNDLHGEACLAWYSANLLHAEMKLVGESLSAPAASSLAEFIHNLAIYSHAKMLAMLPTDPTMAGEYALLYMLTAPDDDHLPWVTQQATQFMRAGISHYGDFMAGIAARHESRAERSAALRYLTMLGNGGVE